MAQRSKGGYRVDLVTVFRIAFVVGILVIPILYVLFVRGADKGNRDRARTGRGERERRGEERGPDQST